MAVAGFVAPYLLETTSRFVEAAARLPGVNLAVITCEPADRLPPQLKDSLAGHWRIDDPLDPGQIAAAVQGLGRQLGTVERLLAVLEQLQVPLAQVREHLGIGGMDPVTANNFRDKDRQARGKPGDWTLHYTTPASVVVMPIPFRFNGVPLP